MCDMRRGFVVAAAMLVGACGGSGAPTAPGPAGGLPLHLSSGLYTLTLDLTDGTGSPRLVCNPPISVTRLTIPVSLQRGDADLTVEAQTVGASLRLHLQVSGDDRLISGTMFGSALSEEGVAIEVFGATARDPALISGRADATSVEGMIIGQVTLAAANCTSAGNNWRLTPRMGPRAE